MKAAREDETTDEKNNTELGEGAPLVDTESFIKHSFEENDGLDNG